MSQRKSWAEFQETGLLWLVNSVLQVFGWSIMVQTSDTTGEVIDAYPVRTAARGCDSRTAQQNCSALIRYVHDNVDVLLDECQGIADAP